MNELDKELNRRLVITILDDILNQMNIELSSGGKKKNITREKSKKRRYIKKKSKYK